VGRYRGGAKPGRLSTLDTLPEWCEDAKLDAFAALKERKLQQQEILDNFNTAIQMAALANGITGDDVPKISRSAFSRKSLRLAVTGRRIEETREIAAVLAPKLDQAGDNSVTLLVAETLKTLISEMLSNAGDLKADGATAEMLMMTARALMATEQSKRISVDMRKKIATDLASRASKAVDAVAKSQGLTAETVDAIKSKILGIQAKPPA
jgi:uncharacterized protein DUF3486